MTPRNIQDRYQAYHKNVIRPTSFSLNEQCGAVPGSYNSKPQYSTDLYLFGWPFHDLSRILTTWKIFGYNNIQLAKLFGLMPAKYFTNSYIICPIFCLKHYFSLKVFISFYKTFTGLRINIDGRQCFMISLKLFSERNYFLLLLEKRVTFTMIAF